MDVLAAAIIPSSSAINFYLEIQVALRKVTPPEELRGSCHSPGRR